MPEEKIAGKENTMLHWSEKLAQRIIKEREEPFIITGGMTTSGPTHLGTVCEFLYPSVIRRALTDLGHKAELHFVGDIMDAFDGVPFELQKYSSVLTPELGKPLAHVKDPLGCHESYGIHYLSQTEEIMKKLKLTIDVVRADRLYESGSFDSYAKLFLHEEQRVKEVVAKSSGKQLSDLANWSPIMPLCGRCGKIATTRVIWHSDDEYEYVCDRDVEFTKGCGHKDKNKISDHKYKLQWRLHWPAWQAFFKSSMEGSGVDHMTKGGSWDTAYAIHKEILHTESPIPYKFGFVLFHGQKASKSKGNVMPALDVLKLIPPELLAYMLVVPNLEQNKDMDPNGDKLITIYDEIERIARLENPKSRADKKKLQAYNLSVKRLAWKAQFIDILMNYQIYKDWKKVGSILKDAAGVKYLSPYITEWLNLGYAPDRYNFSIKPTRVSSLQEVVKAFDSAMQNDMDAIAIHNLVYKTAKEHGVDPQEFFKVLYTALIGKDNGPRIGKLIYAVGVSKSKEIFEDAIKR